MPDGVEQSAGNARARPTRKASQRQQCSMSHRENRLDALLVCTACATNFFILPRDFRGQWGYCHASAQRVWERINSLPPHQHTLTPCACTIVRLLLRSNVGPRKMGKRADLVWRISGGLIELQEDGKCAAMRQPPPCCTMPAEHRRTPLLIISGIGHSMQ